MVFDYDSYSRFTLVNDRLTSILKTGEHSDVTFILKDGKKIYGHKLLFKIASPVFAAMMTGNWLEKDVIEIDDVEIEGFRTVMEFIYTDEVELNSVSHAASVYKIANKYDIPYLQKVSEEYILLNLNVADACEILEFSLLFNRTEVESACKMILKIDTSDVLDASSFLDCNLDTLETIVSDPNLNVDEITLFKSVEKWAEHNCIKQGLALDTLKPCLSGVLNKIRFLSMSVDEFMSGPNKSNLLHDDERQILYKHLIGEDCSSIPEGFSSNSLRRKPSDLEITSLLRRDGKYVTLTARWKKKKILFLEPSSDYTSPSFLLNNFLWKISVKQIKLLGQKYLDLNLICESNQTEDDWSCMVEYTFKIVSQEDGKPDLYSATKIDEFKPDNNICGWNPFILWSAFTNPSFTLIKDDCLIVEVEINFL